MTTTARTAFADAVEDLYRAFARWPLRAWTDPCLTCCASEEQESALHAAPLHLLPAEAIAHYAENAMTTWGDERELNHLLPRMIELAVDVPYGWGDIETLGTAMGRARHSWTVVEQAAVDRALLELWRVELVAESPLYEPGALLCAIGWSSDDLAPHLQAWSTAPETAAARRFVRFLDFDWDPWKAEVDNPFWNGHGDEDEFPRRVQMDQIVAWVLGPDPWRLLDGAISRRDEPTDEFAEALLILEGTTGAARPPTAPA